MRQRDVLTGSFRVTAILFLLVAAVVAAAAAGPAIESIEVVNDAGPVEQLVVRLNGPHTPSIFRIDGDNPRLVLDFFAVSYLAEAARIDGSGGDIINTVRVGRHTDPAKTRIVIDIGETAAYQYDQAFDVSAQTLTVSLSPAAAPPAAAEPRRISVDTGKVKLTPKEGLSPPAETAPSTPEKVIAAAGAEPAVPSNAQVEPERAEPEEQGRTSPIEPETAPEITPPAEPEQRQEPLAAESASPAAPRQEEVAVLSATATKRLAAEQTAESSTAGAEAAGTSPGEEPAGSSVAGEEVAALRTPGETPVLYDVTFEKSINDSETVFFRLNGFYPPIVFGIEKENPRVVCDFLDGTIDAAVRPAIETGGAFVNRIEVSNQEDPAKVRVVLELTPNRNYDLQQLFFREDNLFVIIVKELGGEVEAAVN